MLPTLDGNLFGPVEPRFVLHALLVVAEQSTDHIPSIAAADFDIPLLIDANDRIVEDLRGRGDVRMTTDEIMALTRQR